MTTIHNRIKLALDVNNRLQNIRAIDAELTKYNLPVLQKSAAVGAHKEERIKLAALLQQRAIEKQAFMGGLARLGMRAAKGMLGGAKGVGKGLVGSPNVGKAIGGVGGRTLRQAVPMSQRAGHLLGSTARRGVQAIGSGIGAAGRYAAKNPASAAGLAGGAGLAGMGLGAMAMNPATQLGQAVNKGTNAVSNLYDQGMAMAGGFGQGLSQGAQSLANLPGALAGTLQKGFTGQLGQNSPQGATPGIAPPQQFRGVVPQMALNRFKGRMAGGPSSL